MHSYNSLSNFRSSKKKPRNVFTPMETLHSLKRGDRYSNRYTDKFLVRSDKFVPVSKLPAPRWNWDYDLTDENANFLKQVVTENNSNLMQMQREDSLLNDEKWPIQPWIPGK